MIAMPKIMFFFLGGDLSGQFTPSYQLQVTTCGSVLVNSATGFGQPFDSEYRRPR